MTVLNSAKPRGKLFRGFLCLLLLACSAYMIFCCRFVVTDGTSMEPTFSPGDIVLCARFLSTPEPGDVVLIEHDGMLVIKRIAFTSGEALPNMVWYQTAQNGYTPIEGDTMYWGSNTVPDGFVFVRGDNSATSHDSRYEDFGLVPIEEIWGKVVGAGDYKSE